MGKANRAASKVTLSGTHLDGYAGPMDVITRGKHPLWRRVLRLRRKPQTQRVYAVVKGGTARLWRRTGV